MGIQINGNTDTVASTNIGGSVILTSATLPSIRNISATGVSTFTDGPVLIGSGTSTGTTSQPLQVTGGAYVSGSFGIGTTNPQTALHLGGGGNIRLNRSDNTRSSIIFHNNDGFNINANTVGDDVIINAGNVSGRILLQNNSSSSLIAQSGTVLIGSASSTGTASQRLQVTGGAYVSGSFGIGTTNPVKPLDVRGEATFGAGVLISDLNWGKDTNQLVHTFSGTAGGGNPSDGVIALVSPNANPSATRIGSIVYGNKVSGTAITLNPGIKAVIDCYTNTNVANAADTGAYMNFYTKPDNAGNRVQMTLNSNGVLTKPYQPAFLAYRASTLAVSATWQNISQGILTESYDVGSVYSTSTNGRFVAPVAGKYMFYAGGWSVANSNGERYAFGVKINNTGSPDFLTGGNYCITDSPLAPFQIVLNLAANDYVELFYFSAVSTSIGGGTHVLYWGGYLLG